MTPLSWVWATERNLFARRRLRGERSNATRALPLKEQLSARDLCRKCDRSPAPWHSAPEMSRWMVGIARSSATPRPGVYRPPLLTLRNALRRSDDLRDLARCLLTRVTGDRPGAQRGPSPAVHSDVVMKKRFKLGLTLFSVIGITLFGSSERRSEAVAYSSPEDRDRLPTPLLSLESATAEQVHASLGVKSSATPLLQSPGDCATGMVEVEGDYCPYVEQECLRWLDPEAKQRCAEFAATSTCKSRSAHKHFCVDRFEYPNVPGEKPSVMKTWIEAKATCASEGKRLCGESEWTLACEGRERLPYPYGYARNDEACNIDKPHPDVDEAALADPSRRDAEAARLDQRDPSGARESCVSPYGVYDMTGNVDEWVVNESGKPYKSGLKGGYWGPVRDRCRPMTIAHSEEFSFYQIGFRCCGDPSLSGGPTPAEVGSEGTPRTAPLGAQGTTLTAS
jgi:sulfatase modifying factor 1